MKCNECGLLMFHDPINGQSRSADENARRKGKYSVNMSGHAISRWHCRVNAPAMQQMPEATGQANAVELISQEVECGEFVRLNPAKTAQEHEEMRLVDRVRAENAATQAEMKAMQDKAEARADRAEDRADKAEKRQDKADVRQQRALWLSGAALFVSIVMGFAGPLGVEYLKRHFGWTQPEVRFGTHQTNPTTKTPIDAPGS